MKIKLSLIAVLGTIFSAPVSAENGAASPKYGQYYNQPGASIEQVSRELDDCAQIAKGAKRTRSGFAGTNVSGIFIGGLTNALLSSLTHGAKVRYNIENCMVINGWRLYAMTKAEGKLWKALSDEEREAKLALLVGAQKPYQGQLYRTWQNDYAEPRLWSK